MAPQRIIVTGETGKAGRWIVERRLERGHDVVNVDVHAPERPLCRALTEDLTCIGQTIDACSPHSTGDRTPHVGVIHRAAVPRPHRHPSSEVWWVNTRSERVDEAALISNRRARQVLGWKQAFFPR